MIELKQFHLYAKLSNDEINDDIILSEFKNQFWFDHNLSFGMHNKYFYTLPFHFDHLYKFPKGFDDIKSNNLEIVTNNPRIWHNVKSIELCLPCNYDINFVKELKIKMPKLTSINFVELCRYYSRDTPNLHIIIDEREKIDVTLDNVTSVEFSYESIENQKDWIIYSLPNLRHLVLSDTRLPSIDSELASILNKRIQRLDIYSHYTFKQLTEINDFYFSNIQYINICLSYPTEADVYYANFLKILARFKNLKTLFIYIDQPIQYLIGFSAKAELEKTIQYLEIDGTMKKYEVKHFQANCLFLKRKFKDSEVEDGIPLRLIKPSFFSSLNRFIPWKKRS